MSDVGIPTVNDVSAQVTERPLCQSKMSPARVVAIELVARNDFSRKGFVFDQNFSEISHP